MAELQKKYVKVVDKATLNELITHIGSYEILAIDTETDSLNPRKGKIVGWSVSGTAGEGYYFPTWIYDRVDQQLKEVFIEGRPADEISKKILALLRGKKLVAHNASFDFRFIKNYFKLDLIPDLWVDTAMLVHTVQEEGAFGYGNPFGLKSIAIMNQQALGLDIEKAANEEQLKLKESIKANGGSATKENFEIYKADLDILAEYGAADTDLTLRICNLYLTKLKEEGLEKFFFEEEVMPIYREVTIPMEEVGVALDMELLRKTDAEIIEDLAKNKQVVIKSLLETEEGKNWVVDTAFKKYPPASKGKWAQTLCTRYSINLPKTSSGGYSLTKKAIEALDDSPVKEFLLTGNLDVLDPVEVTKISIQLWKDENDGEYVNIQSTVHLAEIVFKYMGLKAKSKTATGKDQFDMEMLEELAKTHPWAENLRVYNKLLKIKSTYIDRFLNGAEDGRYYFYYKQNGTVSGRYGSDAQQLPKPKEDGQDVPIVVHYNNLVRAFLIAGEGRKFIDSDFESLEPYCFASVTGDEKLREIFNKNWDFYSTIAIRTEKLDEQRDKYPDGVSADKKAPNFLKKLDPVKRNTAKGYALGIAYGMEAYALGMGLGIPQKEAEKLVNGYLDGFPQLKEWRVNSREQVKKHGYIKNYVGRVRHLDTAKKLYDKFGEKILDWKFRKELEQSYGKDFVTKIYRDYKNAMNNCLNYQLQSLAAAVVNRAALQINRKAKQLGIDAQVVMQVHDQLIINVAEERAETFAPIVQNLMETTTVLPGVSLKAPPEIANNLKEGH
jgi:DNA polymerase I-like protein with 3'-5' exonuclease and polymerase domains